MVHKTYKIRLYPNKTQATQIDATIHACRFIYNQMLSERIDIYEKYKDNKEILHGYEYKTEKQYKEEFE